MTNLMQFSANTRSGGLPIDTPLDEGLPRCAEAIVRLGTWMETEGAAAVLINVSLGSGILGMYLVCVTYKYHVSWSDFL